MKRFGYLVLLSAILLEATSDDVLGIPSTTSVPETSTGSAESEAPTVSGYLDTHGTQEAGEQNCSIWCHLSTDELKTNVTASQCTSPGKFPLCDLCPGKYFECSYVDVNWHSTFQLEHFTCPPEKVFNASVGNCLPERQNVSTIVSWKMEDVINSAKNVCSIIKKIDSYDDTTITTLPLRIGLEYQVKINAYVTSFNEDLEVAQSHMRVWRKGQSIVTDIRKTYNKAKGYEKAFNRMYDINNGRMETVGEDSIRQTESLQEDIRELKAEIATLESEPAEENEDMRNFKQMTISHNKDDLVRKEEKLKASTPIALKLAEMSVFLGYVRTHASEVVALATTSRDRIEQLYENITRVNNPFSVHAAKAEKDRDSLISDERNKNRTIQTTRIEIDRLEKEKGQLKAKQNDLTRESEENFERMKSLREEITTEESAFKSIKSMLCKATSIVFKEFLGNCETTLEHLDAKNKAIPLKDKLQQCSEKETRINEELEQLSPQIPAKNNQIKTQSDQISDTEEEIKKIEYEKMAFDMFIQDLQNMKKGITSVLKDLQELLKMIRMTETVFQYIDTDLGKMIDQSEAPKTEDERNMALEKIKNDLVSHQNKLDQPSEKIINMRQCTRLS